MRIALITDLHISATEANPLDIPVKEHFLKVLKIAIESDPDLIILNGDLCHKTGEKSVYEWIRLKLDKTGISYTAIPGNHDDAVLMHQVFGWPLTGQEMYYNLDISNLGMLFLDSSSGIISTQQLQWMKDKIAEKQQVCHIVFMHHPPLICLCRHMEPTYALENMAEVQELFLQFPDRNFYIFCGHYHMEASVCMSNIQVYITPSTFFQIDPDSEHLKKLNNLIGYRNILISEDQKLITAVKYV